MRLLPLALALIAALPIAALSQDRAECEYRNPNNPNWNYLRACTVSVVATGDRTTTTAEVNNGSTLTIVESRAGETLSFEINGYAATRLENDVSRCYLTIDDEETICIHTDGAVPVATAPDEATPAASGPDTNFGGAEAGHCLAWSTEPEREGLLGKGACDRRENCAEIEGEAGVSCLTDYIWESGNETVVTARGDVHTLDGAVAVAAGDGCFTDEEAGLHFCFSRSAMSEAAYPALAMAPAPEPEYSAVSARAAQPAAAAPPAGDRCSFLRDGVEVSSWSCIVTTRCEAPLCTVSYAFDNGTNVTLDTADGLVMLMNGAKADTAVWAEGQVVEVTRPGAPYTFRFTPGVAAVVE